MTSRHVAVAGVVVLVSAALAAWWLARSADSPTRAGSVAVLTADPAATPPEVSLREPVEASRAPAEEPPVPVAATPAQDLRTPEEQVRANNLWVLLRELAKASLDGPVTSAQLGGVLSDALALLPTSPAATQQGAEAVFVLLHGGGDGTLLLRARAPPGGARRATLQADLIVRPGSFTGIRSDGCKQLRMELELRVEDGVVTQIELGTKLDVQRTPDFAAQVPGPRGPVVSAQLSLRRDGAKWQPATLVAPVGDDGNPRWEVKAGSERTLPDQLDGTLAQELGRALAPVWTESP